MASRTVRAHVQAQRSSTDPNAIEPVIEKRVILDDQGGVLELDIIEQFACGCSREQPARCRCRGCGLLFCSSCPHIGHALTSIPYCGNCARVVRHRDGRLERVPRRGYWKLRVKRLAEACLGGFLSLFIEREDRS